MQKHSTMVATMAGGPQIVTFALDELLQRGEVIQEVIVMHLTPQDNPLTAQALVKLAAEFEGGCYAGQPCRLQFMPLRFRGKKLDDIRDETAAYAAWEEIYKLIVRLKSEGRQLHVCISGGRRILALLAMSAAQLHFETHDRLWHMYTPQAFIERSSNGAIMHAQPEDGVRLIQVYVASFSPGLSALPDLPPMEALEIQASWTRSAEHVRCQKVIERLTKRQEDVLRAFAEGQKPQEVAETLHISISTVNTHKTVVLEECRNAWELEDGQWLTYHFLHKQFGRYYTTRGLLTSLP